MNSTSEIITVADLKNLLGELRGMARSLLSGESNARSLTPTALALTALRRAKISDQDWDDVRWENRAHFFSVLITAMKHTLIDRARFAKAKGRDKIVYVPDDHEALLSMPIGAEERPERIIVLDEALAKLKEQDARLAEVIDQFYYAGYTVAEMATFSSKSEKTVDRDLKKARTILKKMMEANAEAA